MAMTINFSADLEPVPFPRPMSSGKRRFNPPRYSAFKRDLGLIARHAMHGRAPFTGKLNLHADFFKSRPKDISSQRWGDGDNFLKAVMDALQGVCYLNDAQIVHGSFSKFFGEPHIIITLETLT